MSKRYLRPQYGTADGKFNYGIYDEHHRKPEQSNPPDYVQLAKNELYRKFRQQFNKRLHKEKTADIFASNSYQTYEWVDCLDNTSRRMETHKNIDNMVLRYCANKKTIPKHIPERDVFNIFGPTKRSIGIICPSTNMAYGYGYYVEKFTDPSQKRIIEADIDEGYLIVSHTWPCSAFMEYYKDEFTLNEINAQHKIEHDLYMKEVKNQLQYEREMESLNLIGETVCDDILYDNECSLDEYDEENNIIINYS